MIKRIVYAVSIVGALAAGCSSDPDLGGETHWLGQCNTDTDCGDARCLCGLCSRTCSGDDECGGGPPAQCESVSSPWFAGHCAGSNLASTDSVCLATCQGDAECSEGLSCVEGSCVGSVVGPSMTIDEIRIRNVTKMDLLFVVDNSISMADKQKVLEAAVPDLVQRLVDPPCRNEETGASMPPPADPSAPCPDPGFVREFARVRDLHVGVISSSLGSAGTPACDPALGEQQNDRGHLIGGRPRALNGGLNLASEPEGTPGFLQWGVSGQSLDSFRSVFQQLVVMVGENGCGYQSTLESMYRFLADPNPPADVEIVPCSPGSPADCARPVGIDEQLLAQRAAFLRPDSLLSIVVISSENDCSVQQTGQLYYAMRNIDLPRSTPVCAVNPNDPCCYSCAMNPPAECSQPKPPECTDPLTGTAALVPDEADDLNLRCWDQKRRYGIDFLYPVERYTRALTEPVLCTESADLNPEGCTAEARVPNPIFQDLTGSGASTRDPSLVFLTGIVGVPWQDIQATASPDGDPYPANELHYLTAYQMREQGKWAEVLGDPSASPPAQPSDPLMIESIAPRSGTSATGTQLAGPNSGYLANPINGHEWTIAENNDLQYACIFPLGPDAKDCNLVPDNAGCDCRENLVPPNQTQNPVCQQADGTYTNIQTFAKAYPGLRHLELLEQLGDSGVVASICPKHMNDPTQQDYGYRPAMEAIFERLRPALTGKCLSGRPAQGPDGYPQCSVIEAVAGPGNCDRPGRLDASSTDAQRIFGELENKGACGAGSSPCDESAWTLCEIMMSTTDSTSDGIPDCLQDGVGPSDVGWCYIDPAEGLGDAALVETCAPDEKRLIRFVDPDNATPLSESRTFIACTDN